ncbi:MAG: hypothetical protein WCT31_03690, partial [Candidatus Micrarchaeia archaeon]
MSLQQKIIEATLRCPHPRKAEAVNTIKRLFAGQTVFLDGQGVNLASEPKAGALTNMLTQEFGMDGRLFIYIVGTPGGKLDYFVADIV